MDGQNKKKTTVLEKLSKQSELRIIRTCDGQQEILFIAKHPAWKIDGRRDSGRRRISQLKNIRQWFGQTTTSLFRNAVNKVQIMMTIVNARRGHGT